MVNRVIQSYNQVLQSVGDAHHFLSRSYLDAFAGAPVTLSLEELAPVNSINMYYTLSGYEMYGTREENARRLASLANLLVNSCYQHNKPFVFLVGKDAGALRVSLGVNYLVAPGIKDTVMNNLHGAIVANTGLSAKFVSTATRHAGLITGVARLDAGDIDLVINAMGRKGNYVLAVLAVPVDKGNISGEIQRLNAMIQSLQQVASRRETFGSGRQRVFESENSAVVDLLELCNQLKDNLNTGLTAGMWHTCIWFGGDSPDTATRLAGVASGALQKNIKMDSEQGYREMPRVLYTDVAFINNSIWHLPVISLYAVNIPSLYANSLTTVIGSAQLASLCQFPAESHPGYLVRHLGESRISQGGFDKSASTAATPGSILLGRIDQSDDAYYLPADMLVRHAFVAGGTGSGKSTTVRKLLSQLATEGIPFVVLEAAKKEYWELTMLRGMENVRVYSGGQDTLSLKLNPFEPEDGALLSNHIDALAAAFLSLFDAEDPIPLVISELLKLAYEKRGWNPTRRAYRDSEKPYPVIQDMLDHLDECIDSIGYAPEVRNNVRGALKVRLRSLTQGHYGNVLNTHENISARDLYATSAIVELDDFTGKTKSFIAGIIALKVGQFAKQCAASSNLDRLLVLEEAHHLLPNSEQADVSQAKGEAAGYFANMLSEVRAYGTGLVIADQSPAYIARNAIRNSAVKILHNLSEGDDIQAIKSSVGLKDFQVDLTRTLKPGQAVVAVAGWPEVVLVQVDSNMEHRKAFNLACLQCCRENCNHAAVIAVNLAIITQRERNYIQGNGYTLSNLRRLINDLETRVLEEFPRHKKLCLAGLLVRGAAENVQRCRETLYDYYQYILGEGQ